MCEYFLLSNTFVLHISMSNMCNISHSCYHCILLNCYSPSVPHLVSLRDREQVNVHCDRLNLQESGRQRRSKFITFNYVSIKWLMRQWTRQCQMSFTRFSQANETDVVYVQLDQMPFNFFLFLKYILQRICKLLLTDSCTLYLKSYHQPLTPPKYSLHSRLALTSHTFPIVASQYFMILLFHTLPNSLFCTLRTHSGT